MREYCEYIVVDIETKYALVMGKKYKDFSEMYVNDTYRKYLFFGRKIREYYKLKTVGGRTCVIIGQVIRLRMILVLMYCQKE